MSVGTMSAQRISSAFFLCIFFTLFIIKIRVTQNDRKIEYNPSTHPSQDNDRSFYMHLTLPTRSSNLFSQTFFYYSNDFFKRYYKYI